MDTALKLVEAIQHLSFPNILAILGGLFLLLAFVGKIGSFLEIPPTRQKWAALLGALVLMTGIVLSVTLHKKPGPTHTGPGTMATPASGDEVYIGPLAYKLVSIQRSSAIPGKLSLLLTIRLTANDIRARLYSASFRLFVDNVPQAPEREPKLSERVESNRAVQGAIRFVIPDTATDAQLQILGQGAYKDERQFIPIPLKETKP